MKSQTIYSIIAVVSTTYFVTACGKNPAFRVIPVAATQTVDTNQTVTKETASTNTTSSSQSDSAPSTPNTESNVPNQPNNLAVSTEEAAAKAAQPESRVASKDEIAPPQLKTESPASAANHAATAAAKPPVAEKNTSVTDKKETSKSEVADQKSEQLRKDILSTLTFKSDLTPTAQELVQLKTRIASESLIFSRKDLQTVEYASKDLRAPADKFIKLAPHDILIDSGYGIYAKSIIPWQLYKVEVRGSVTPRNKNEIKAPLTGFIYTKNVAAVIDAGNLKGDQKKQAELANDFLKKSDLQIYVLKLKDVEDKIILSAGDNFLLAGKTLKSGITRFATHGKDFDGFHFSTNPLSLTSFGITEGSLQGSVENALLSNKSTSIALVGSDANTTNMGTLELSVAKPRRTK